MLGWLNPSALWALTLVAVPVVIHLLRTHHAKRVVFPTLRFVQPSRAAAVRMRLPSDVLLMCVRMGIVAAAAAAVAQPILLTGARVSVWDTRVARAVVVDRSDSMRAPHSIGIAPETAAAEASAAELRTATYGAQFDADDLEAGVVRAARWLATQPPARREIVVVSDLQRGSITDGLVDAAGQGSGLRFVRVGRDEGKASFDGAPLFGVSGHDGRTQRVDVTPQSTAVALSERPDANMTGFRVVAAPGSDAKVARLLRAVATAGAHSGSTGQPIVIRLSGAPDRQGSIVPIASRWMLRTVLRLRESRALAGSPGDVQQMRVVDDQGPWTIVARGAKAQPLVRAAATNRELVIDVAATPDDFFAATVIRAVLDARVDAAAYDEREIARVDDASVAAMTRSAEPVTKGAWRTAETSDARWCWLLALLLLGLEQWLRRSDWRQSSEVTRVAA